jgi:fused signal recognition particle receptor
MPALQLPERPLASLPHPASLPGKPLRLPSVAEPGDATGKPALAPGMSAPGALEALSAEASNRAPPPAATLPPLGPAINVATPPMPPERVPAPAVVAPPPAPPVTAPAPQRSLELSDLWHPYRVVAKGLNWAGDQLPVIGGDGDGARPAATPPRELPPTPIRAAASVHAAPVAKPAAPIPLLPDANPEAADKPPSGKPGPGSGGLY